MHAIATGPFGQVLASRYLPFTEQAKRIIWKKKDLDSSSCPNGADEDFEPAFYSRFRVRGVSSLRVIGASVFPRIPHIFVALPYLYG